MSGPTPNSPMLKVAAGVIADHEGCVLIAQRTAPKALAGAWEFPGGKIRDRETSLQALVRELDEELGIEVLRVRYLARYPWSYPDRTVVLHAWRVLDYAGRPEGCEGQPLRWCAPQRLLTEGLLPADAPIVEALRRIPAGSRVQSPIFS